MTVRELKEILDIIQNDDLELVFVSDVSLDSTEWRSIIIEVRNDDDYLILKGE